MKTTRSRMSAGRASQLGSRSSGLLRIFKPSLLMDFINRQFSVNGPPVSMDSIITTTRPSTGGRFNEQGLYESVPINQLRFDYDPVSKLPLGILIEEGRTNLLRNSGGIGLLGWSVNATSYINQGVARSPDGGDNASKIGNNGTGGAYIFHAVAISGSPTLTLSVYAKASKPGDVLRLQLIELGGSTGNQTATGPTIQLTDQWQRLVFTATVQQPDRTGVQFILLTASGAEALVWGAQMEVGSFATSLIETGASQVTRTADSVRVNTISPWYNQNEGTLYVEGKSYAPGSVLQEYVSLRGAGGYHGVRLINETMGSKLLIRDEDGPDVSIIHAGRYLDTKRAAGIKPGDYAYASGGALLRNTTTEAVNPTRLEIGRGPAAGFCGHIRAIRYYPRRLTNAELQALTT